MCDGGHARGRRFAHQSHRATNDHGQRPSAHFAHWPPGLPKHLTLPQTHLFYNVEVSASAFPDKPFVIFYDTPLSFAGFQHDAERIAGWLQREANVQPGDRVLLDMQNSPQWLLAYYGILRADAVVVPMNPMNRTDELRHYVADTGASVAFVAQDLLPEMQPLLGIPSHDGPGLHRIVVATYSDWLRAPTDLVGTGLRLSTRPELDGEGLIAWQDVIDADHAPGPMCAGRTTWPSCRTHRAPPVSPRAACTPTRSVMCTVVTSAQWLGRTQDAVALSVLPLFHVTGMVGGMNSLLYVGATRCCCRAGTATPPRPASSATASRVGRRSPPWSSTSSPTRACPTTTSPVC